MNLRPQPRKPIKPLFLQKELEIDWKSFKEWLFRDYSRFTADGRFRYAKKYAHLVLNRDFGELRLFSSEKRRHVLLSLCSLAKFLGVYAEFRRLMREYGFGWSAKNLDDLIISRLTKVVDSDEVFEWIRRVKREIPDLREFMDLIAVTGLRFVEAIDSYNLICSLSSEGKLRRYFNPETGVLEHFRFKDKFIRRSKKAFISFVEMRLVEKISGNNPLGWNAIQLRVKRNIGRQRFSDIRELHATILTKHLRQPEIDFLHGRVSTSVFMRNYFNPAWISDLKERTLRAAEEMLNTIQG